MGPDLLILFRHAESKEQLAKRGQSFLPDMEGKKLLTGLTDSAVPLTPRGARHARDTGVVLLRRYGPLDVIYHSDYVRTSQTAYALLQAYPVHLRDRVRLVPEKLLRERSKGHLFDKTFEEIGREFPKFWEMHSQLMEFRIKFPGGDSLEKKVDDAKEFCRNEFPRLTGRRAGLVGHWGTLLAIRYYLEGWDEQKILQVMGSKENPSNCGITVYRKTGKERFELVECNVQLVTASP
ncbi:MAG TPA: histidine phosphatase family protein [Verrucomicrobiae bacterium]|nr:histidine phosphatase family protein [Verrucomicrobiae bacterium]